MPHIYRIRASNQLTLAPGVSVTVTGVSRRISNGVRPVHRFALEHHMLINRPDGTTLRSECKPVEAWLDGNIFLELARSLGFDVLRDVFLKKERDWDLALYANEEEEDGEDRDSHEDNADQEERLRDRPGLPPETRYFRFLRRVLEGEVSTANKLCDVRGVDEVVALSAADGEETSASPRLVKDLTVDQLNDTMEQSVVRAIRSTQGAGPPEGAMAALGYAYPEPVPLSRTIRDAKRDGGHKH